MRLDHTLYLVAVITFIIAGLLFSYQIAYKEIWIASTTVLGLLFLGLGYSQKPKDQVKSEIIKASAPLPQASPISSSIETQKKISTANDNVSHQKSISNPSSTTFHLTDIKGIGKKRAELLRNMGVTTIESLAKASAEDVAAKLRVSVKTANTWIESAKKLIESPD